MQRKRETKLVEKGDFRLFAADGKRKRQTSVCLMQMKRKTEVCFPWSANDKR